MNITLIGMPGSGKSYIGEMLASELEYDLVELDAIFEERYKLPLPLILTKLGETDFLTLQAKDAIEATSGKSHQVISPGGSIVYSNDAMDHLKKVSSIVYLETSFATIAKRIGEVPRGIVGLKNRTLEELYNERTILYAKWAHATVNAEQEPQLIIEDIKQSLL